MDSYETFLTKRTDLLNRSYVLDLKEIKKKDKKMKERVKKTLKKLLKKKLYLFICETI